MNVHISKLGFKIIGNYDRNGTNRVVSLLPLKENMELMDTIGR